MRRRLTRLTRIIPAEPWLLSSAAVLAAGCGFLLGTIASKDDLPSLVPYVAGFNVLALACVVGAILTIPRKRGPKPPAQ